MKDNNRLIPNKIFVIAFSLTLVGCTAASSFSTPSVEPIFSGTATAVNPILTPTVPQPVSPTPSMEPTHTPTSATIPTPTPTIQPTITELPFVIPTPLGSDTNEQVIWLLETNNGCRLPCWWGITPGETEWNAAEKILTLFDTNIYSASASGFDYYNPTIPLPFGPYEVNQVSPIYTVQNGIVSKIETQVSIGDSPSGYFTQYTLPTFLNTYGQPGEVWISTYSSTFEEKDLPFFIVLYYPDQGIVAVYDDNGETQGDLVQGCPQEKPASAFVLLPPDITSAFEEIVRNTSGLGQRDYLPLEEAAGMDMETFFETGMCQ